MAEPRNRQPRDRNTFSLSTDRLDRDLRRLRTETDSVRQEVENKVVTIQGGESTATFANGIQLGQVSSFDPVSQVAQVTLLSGQTFDMGNFATFQLVPGDTVACGVLEGGVGYVILGIVRSPDYIPPSWAIPIVDTDFPLQVDTLTHPMNVGQQSWVVDFGNELGFGAGTIVGIGDGPGPEVVILTPGLTSVISMPITSSAGTETAVTLEIFDGRLFVLAPATTADSSRYFSIHVWGPSIGWYEDLTSSNPNTYVTPFARPSSARFVFAYNRLYFTTPSYSASNPITRSAAAVLYINMGDADFSVAASAAYNSFVSPMIRLDHVWWSSGQTGTRLRYNPLGTLTSFSSYALDIAAPTGVAGALTAASASIDDNGTLWWTYNSSGDIVLSACSVFGATQTWASVFDPLDRPVGTPGPMARPGGGLYVAGSWAYNDGTLDYRAPAIWQTDGITTTRIWTGTVHTVVYELGTDGNYAVSTVAGLWFPDIATARWNVLVRNSDVQGLDGRFLYQANL